MKFALSFISTVLLAFASAAWADSFLVHIEVDAAQSIGVLKPVWRFFGADEPNYAYMPHGRELLGELGELKKDEVFFRTHSLLSTGKGEHGLKWARRMPTRRMRRESRSMIGASWIASLTRIASRA